MKPFTREMTGAFSCLPSRVPEEETATKRPDRPVCQARRVATRLLDQLEPVNLHRFAGGDRLKALLDIIQFFKLDWTYGLR